MIIGGTSLSALARHRQHHRHLLMPCVERVQQCCRRTCRATKRPRTTSQQNNDDFDYDDFDNSDNDDDDFDYDDEVAEILAKEERRRTPAAARRARYRARHPDRVAASKKRYRVRHPDKVAEQRRRYRARYRAKVNEYQRRYYTRHREERQVYERQRRQSEQYRAYQKQYRVEHREAILARKREYPARQRQRDKERTLEKIKALGPLKLTIELEDYLKPVNTPVETFCQSLEADDNPQFSFRSLLEESYTLMDLDSGGASTRGST